MSRYSCKCPSPGCDFVLEVSARGLREALKKMYAGGHRHLVEKHPDFPEASEKCLQEYTRKKVATA